MGNNKKFNKNIITQLTKVATSTGVNYKERVFIIIGAFSNFQFPSNQFPNKFQFPSI